MKKYSCQLSLIVGLLLLSPRAALCQTPPDEASISDPVTREDVLALYNKIINAEKSSAIKGDRGAEETIRKLARPLQSCADTRHHLVIAELLMMESKGLPRNFSYVFGYHNNERDKLRFARISLLIDIAGRGKNNAALPALRKIVKKGGSIGSLASTAVGHIGDPQDLDNFVRQIIKNPRSNVDLSGFGVAGIDRIMREVDSLQLSPTASGALIARLRSAKGPGAAQRFTGLLKHPDRRVVETVSLALAESMAKDDIGAINEMINDPDREVRFQGLNALEQKAWSEDKAPIVIGLLKNDPDEGVRAYAATILGHKNVKSAEVDLREAVLRDPSSRVESAAEGSLKFLSDEYQRQEDRRIEEIRQNQK